MDLSKLTPAPWFVDRDHANFDVAYGTQGDASDTFSLLDRYEETDYEFIALARNALDVMMRRKWMAMCDVEAVGGWWVEDARGTPLGMPRCCPDPFTAIVEADKWYAENVEKKGKPLIDIL